jgi:hypothetical protein
MKICNISDCLNKHHAKGMCNNHYARLYYEQNKEKVITNVKQNRLKNLDNIKQTKSEYYQKNKEKIKNKSIKYYQENKEDALRRQKLWSKNNKDKRRAVNRRRKARKFNNYTEVYTEKQVLETYGTTCYLCNDPIDMQAPRLVGKTGWEKGLHIEHVVDLALGGPDALHNVRPSHGICNLTKKPRGMV